MSDITTLMMGAAGQVGGDYQISRSLRFNYDDSTYLNRTPANAGNQKTWTWSGWVKPSAVGVQNFIFSAGDAYNVGDCLALQFDTASQFRIRKYAGGVGTNVKRTTQVFRDTSAWYHIVVAIDTTNATEEDRQRLYVNGERVTDFIDSNNYALDDLTSVNTIKTHIIGNLVGFATGYYRGYLADINFIDGQALTPSSFGEVDSVTGVWKPIAYAGTYGTNGFHLDFSDNSSTTALGYDAAGSNDWTPNNFSVTAGAGNDSLVDTPTQYGTDTGAGGEVRGNYATLNPLNGLGTISNGNLTQTNSNADHRAVAGTFGMSSGKWYWEVTLTTAGTNTSVGIAKPTVNFLSTQFVGQAADAWGYVASNGEKYNNNTNAAYGSSWNTSGTVIGIAFNADAGTLVFYRNNVSQGTAFSSLTSGPYVPAVSNYSSGLVDCNFGQRPFAYTAPSGFKALCTTNLPDPTVVQGDDYFNTVLYTGTGSSQNITGVGFQPDFVWIKERSGAADHALYDAVRGVQQQLESNTTTDETTESTGLTAFGTNGFTVGSLAQVNTSTDTYVAWNWKESTVSKFDIVTYTGNGTARTISHNLGVVPNMIIVKARTTASTDQGWPVYHSANTANPETDYLLLNSTAATADLDTVWNDTAPTSSVFSVGTNALVNANNDTYVAYLFANVAGYSAFGSYTGNGSTDGPFVYTGFRPAFVMFKVTSGAGDWVIEDVARSPTNEMDARLFPSTSDQETSNGNGKIDYLSNGFKLRNAHTLMNASGSTYIYIAFASNPFKTSLAR